MGYNVCWITHDYRVTKSVRNQRNKVMQTYCTADTRRNTTGCNNTTYAVTLPVWCDIPVSPFLIIVDFEIVTNQSRTNQYVVIVLFVLTKHGITTTHRFCSIKIGRYY